ncbi:hypothetical protein V6B08_11425 [Ferrovibrio sp. MS7]|uniref:DUF7946 domain-containing protein n=1 Tax=Ferrovibrio plantarum TaxID=3119164 RepID=UPI0031358541
MAATQPVFTPFTIKFDGLDAHHNRMDLRTLGVSISGVSKILNSAASTLLWGEVPKKKAIPRIKFYAAPVEKPGSYPIPVEALFTDPSTINLMSEWLAALGSEAIQRLFSIVMLSSSARSNEVDAHFAALMELTQKIREDAAASQQLLLARNAESESRLIDLVKHLTKENQKFVIEATTAIGNTCSQMQLGELRTGGVVIDIPTAQSIRSPDKVEIGDLTQYRVVIDGFVAHNMTVQMFINGDDKSHITGDLADPQAKVYPNIYTQNIRHKMLEITAKPTFKGGAIHRLTVMDAKLAEQ